jgi:DinB family protein
MDGNKMTRHSKIVVAVASFAGILCAQTAGSRYADLKKLYTPVKENLQKMAEQMPEENYSFRPTPDMRTFGELMAHVADVQGSLCAAGMGTKKPPSPASLTAKNAVVAALKASSELCDAALDALTDATAVQITPVRGLSKLGVLEFNYGHSEEEYGYGSVYMRLKSQVPPSTAAAAPHK